MFPIVKTRLPRFRKIERKWRLEAPTSLPPAPPPISYWNLNLPLQRWNHSTFCSQNYSNNPHSCSWVVCRISGKFEFMFELGYKVVDVDKPATKFWCGKTNVILLNAWHYRMAVSADGRFFSPLVHTSGHHHQLTVSFVGLNTSWIFWICVSCGCEVDRPKIAQWQTQFCSNVSSENCTQVHITSLWGWKGWNWVMSEDHQESNPALKQYCFNGFAILYWNYNVLVQKQYCNNVVSMGIHCSHWNYIVTIPLLY